MIFPLGILKTTLMRLRSELNSSVLRIWYITSGCEPSACFSRTKTMSDCLRVSRNPNSLAAEMKASSSGDSAWYCTSASAPSGITVWQMAMARTKCSSSSASGSDRHAVPIRRSSWKLNPRPDLPASGVSSAGRGCPLRRAMARSTSVWPWPYNVPAMEHLKNSITLHVSVPVLSERMVCTCPSSSFRLDVRAIAGVSVAA
mmetsp:Transcript_7346/g.13916  ORF Transcript_7346/g.13916 Transcript_7346/m.13916 type:complete len:201 (-) Transcript_7346:1084-1686(-)